MTVIEGTRANSLHGSAGLLESPSLRRVGAAELRRRLHRLGLAVISCGGATDEELRRRGLPPVCGSPPGVALWSILYVADPRGFGSSYVRTAMEGMPANVACAYVDTAVSGGAAEIFQDINMPADPGDVREAVRLGRCACAACVEAPTPTVRTEPGRGSPTAMITASRMLEQLRTRAALLEVDDDDRSGDAAARSARTTIATLKSSPSAVTIRKLRAGLEARMKTRDKVVEEAGMKGDDAALLALERYGDGLDDAEAAEMVATATRSRRCVNPIDLTASRRGGQRTPPERYELRLADLEAHAAAWLSRHRVGLDVRPGDGVDPEAAREQARHDEVRRRNEAAVAELRARARTPRPTLAAEPPPGRLQLVEPDEAADPAAVVAAQLAARARLSTARRAPTPAPPLTTQ